MLHERKSGLMNSEVGLRVTVRVWLISLFLQLLGGLVGGLLVAPTGSEGQLLAVAALCGLCLNALYLSACDQVSRRHQWAEAVGLRAVRGWKLRGISLGAALSCGWVLVIVLLSQWLVRPEEPGNMALMAAELPLVWLVLCLAFAPWVEERVFRGYGFAGLRPVLGERKAALLVNVLFVAAHYAEIRRFPLAAVPIGLLGALAMRLRIQTGSIFPGYWVHVGYNGMLAMLVLLAWRQGAA